MNAKVQALSAIAQACAEIDAKQSIALFRQALESAKEIDILPLQGRALKAIAEAMLKPSIQAPESVYSLFKGTSDMAKSFQKLIRLNSEMMQDLSPSVLKQVVEREKEEGLYDFNLRWLILFNVRLKNLKAARDIAMLNGDDKDKAKALAWVLRDWAEFRNSVLVDKESQDH